jgi:hypothetical protein
MSIWDRFIKADGKVQSLPVHMAVCVGLGMGVAIVIHILNALALPVAIAGGLYVGYQTWQADKRINGG